MLFLQKRSFQFCRSQPIVATLVGAGWFWLLTTQPAQAHHAMAGKLPKTAVEGLLSGLAHPVIGIDHALFVVAIGLLAALRPQSWWIVAAVLPAALLGTAAHVAGLSAPLPELWIAGSVLLLGLLLGFRHRWGSGAIAATAVVAAIAGLFHGYAYGESIVGAVQSALVAYLVGFTVMQMVVAAIAFGVGRWALGRSTSESQPLGIRAVGFAIAGAGFVLLANNLMGLVLPA